MSFKADPLKKKANYYSIKDASFRLPSHKDDSEAIRRDFTNPKTGEEGTSWERAYKALYGVITDISFSENTLKDGTTLRSLNITLGEDENGVLQIVSIPSDSRYATNFLKRLPSIDLNREVRLMPYDFEKDGPRQVGISVYHKNAETDAYTEKVDDTYFTKVEEKDGKKVYINLHGFPDATEEDASDWPFYFKKVNKFLISYTKQNICPRFSSSKTFKSLEEEQAAKEPSVKSFRPSIAEPSDDIPF